MLGLSKSGAGAEPRRRDRRSQSPADQFRTGVSSNSTTIRSSLEPNGIRLMPSSPKRKNTVRNASQIRVSRKMRSRKSLSASESHMNASEFSTARDRLSLRTALSAAEIWSLKWMVFSILARLDMMLAATAGSSRPMASRRCASAPPPSSGRVAPAKFW
jgi:hypothetical protein